MIRLYEIEWELEAREPADWDAGARTLLETFLTAHIPYSSELRTDRDLSAEKIRHALTRHGKPVWKERDVHTFLETLQYAGYGWLRPASVRARLDELARHLQELPFA